MTANSKSSPTPVVFVRDGVAYAASCHVAAYLGKRHNNFMRTIRDFCEKYPKDTEGQFVESTYVAGNGRIEPGYEMTQRGLWLLAEQWPLRTRTLAKQYLKAFGESPNEDETESPSWATGQSPDPETEDSQTAPDEPALDEPALDDPDNEVGDKPPTSIAVVHVRNGRIFANTRDVAALFKKRHHHVLDAYENLHCSPEFRDTNFRFCPYRVGSNGREYPSWDMTKDGFAFLVMGFTGPEAGRFKEAYIAEFNRMEMALKAGLPVNYLESLEHLLAAQKLIEDQQKRDEEQRALIARQQLQLKAQEPEVMAFQRIAEAEGTYSLTAAAKVMGLGRDALTERLQRDKFIFKRPGSDWEGYQRHVEAGILTHKLRTFTRIDGTEFTKSQVRVTSRGVTEFAKRYTTQRQLDLGRSGMNGTGHPHSKKSRPDSHAGD